jgi:peptidyl-prolyl cis-trans isomerase SurA
MFTLLDKSFNQADLARFMAEHQTKKKDIPANAVVDQFYDQFVNESCMNLKESRLELEYPEFKALMEEYRDGILLFELTDRKVWSKAVKDTAGLKAFYEKNKTNYMWGDRADVDIYTCSTEAAAKLVAKGAKKGNDYEAVTSNVNQNKKVNDAHAVSSRTGRFNKGENEYVDKVVWKKGIAPMFTADGKFIVVNFREVLPAQPKSLEEAKGLVTADFQNVLEKQWLDALRAKYTWSVNQSVLQQVK